MKIRWWPHSTSQDIASFRIRCLAPMTALRGFGHDSELLRSKSDEDCDVIVLVKRYDASSLKRAVSMRRRRGTRLVLDLCDNHLYLGSAPQQLRSRANSLQAAIREVDLVVVPGQALANVVQSSAAAAVEVVGDTAELPLCPPLRRRLFAPAAELGLRRLLAALDRSGAPLEYRLLWFGNRGSPGVDGGISDLLSVAERLGELSRTKSATLTVVSNSEAQFRATAALLPIRSFYLPWNRLTFSRVARAHSTAIIPITVDAFTRCKSDNRVVSSLVHGLNVVADVIPSYQEFNDCVVLGDWRRGLGDYLEDAPLRSKHLQVGLERIRLSRTASLIAERWHQMLSTLLNSARRP